MYICKSMNVTKTEVPVRTLPKLPGMGTGSRKYSLTYKTIQDGDGIKTLEVRQRGSPSYAIDRIRSVSNTPDGKELCTQGTTRTEPATGCVLAPKLGDDNGLLGSSVESPGLQCCSLETDDSDPEDVERRWPTPESHESGDETPPEPSTPCPSEEDDDVKTDIQAEEEEILPGQETISNRYYGDSTATAEEKKRFDKINALRSEEKFIRKDEIDQKKTPRFSETDLQKALEQLIAVSRRAWEAQEKSDSESDTPCQRVPTVDDPSSCPIKTICGSRPCTSKQPESMWSVLCRLQRDSNCGGAATGMVTA